MAIINSMKRALSLCGGGSLGSYEIGAYQMLLEEGYDFDIFTGTSIGAINAAVLATEPFEKIKDLWDKATIEQVMANGINIARGTWKQFDFKANWPRLKAFMRSFIHHKGADISPLRELIENTFDPHKVKDCGKTIGIVATKFPQMREADIILNDTPTHDMVDYILASASAFPLFPVYKVKGKCYIDGGYVNNLPIDLAFNLGADEVVAILLHAIPDVPQHVELLSLPIVKSILPSRDTGFMMDFRRDVLDANKTLGYLDAGKRVGRYWGYSFAFEKERKWENEAKRFQSYLARDFLSDYPRAENIIAYPPYELNRPVDILIRPLEIIGDALGLEYLRVYKIDEFIKAAMEKLQRPEYQKKAEAFARKRSHILGIKDNEIDAFLAYALSSYKSQERDYNLRKTSHVDPLAGVLFALCRFVYYRHLIS